MLINLAIAANIPLFWHLNHFGKYISKFYYSSRKYSRINHISHELSKSMHLFCQCMYSRMGHLHELVGIEFPSSLLHIQGFKMADSKSAFNYYLQLGIFNASRLTAYWIIQLSRRVIKQSMPCITTNSAALHILIAVIARRA